MTNHLANLGVSVLFFFLFYSLGTICRRKILSSDDRLFFLPFDIGFGAILVSLVMFGLGIFHLFTPLVGKIWLGFSIISLFNPPLWKTVRAAVSQLHHIPKPAYPLIALSGILLAMAVMSALGPPSTKDDLVYHLQVPKAYFQHQGFLEFPSNIYSYFPYLGEMLYLAGMMAGSDRVPALLHCGFGLCVFLAIYLFARQLGVSKLGSWVAVAAVATTSVVWREMGTAYVDVLLTLFVLLGLMSLFEWPVTRHNRWMIMIGVALGAAYSVKISALVFFPLFFLVYLFLLRQQANQSGVEISIREVVTASVVVGLTAAVIMLPWMARSFYLTHNPVFPFLFGIFPTQSTGWDAQRAADYALYLQGYGSPDKNLLDYLLLPFKISLFGQYEVPERYDAVVGIFYLLFLPALFTIRLWGAQIRLLLIFVGGYWGYWMFSSQQGRFLLPLFPVLAILIVYSFEQWKTTVRDQIQPQILDTIFFMVCSLTLIWNTVQVGQLFHKLESWPLLTGQISEPDFLRSKFPEYALFEYINRELPPTAKLFLVYTGNRTYYLERPFLTAYVFEDFAFIQLVMTSANADEMAAKLHQQGVTHVLINPRFLVDPTLNPFQTSAEQQRAKDFLTKSCQSLKSANGLILLKLNE
ncbi:MAG: phospholipid carrier-dependent glycosyltransferase [Acidobacteria bacterium]|nr:phospholipid carrier-dependent glycosyltransferase [Acidobacteriota bacterium]